MNGPVLSIVRAGLACPVGLRRRPAVAAMRAGIVRFDLDEERDDVTVARTGPLALDLDRTSRARALAYHALDEVLDDPPPGGWNGQLPVFLSLPQADSAAPFDSDSLLGALRQRITDRAGVEAVLTHECVISDSRAGVFRALVWAQQILAQGRYPSILIGAIDSLADPTSVERLDREGYLLGSCNLDGRVLGQAAVFMLVSAPHAVPRAQCLAQISFVGESHHEESFELFRAGRAFNHATGLSQLFRSAVDCFPHRTDVVVSGQPTEAYWARELAYAYLRSASLMPEPMRLLQTGAEIGDAGAAGGGVALIRALDELQPSQWRPPCASALAYAVSDHGHTGAALFTR